MGECYSPLWALVVTAPDLFLWDLGKLKLQAEAVLSSVYPTSPLYPLSLLPARLVLRRLYPLAIQICEYLRLPEVQGVSRILAHWACYKVRM